MSPPGTRDAQAPSASFGASSPGTRAVDASKLARAASALLARQRGDAPVPADSPFPRVACLDLGEQGFGFVQRAGVDHRRGEPQLDLDGPLRRRAQLRDQLLAVCTR